MKEKLSNQILLEESSWFDTHPPLFSRVGALKKAKLKGVLKVDGPATLLFKDFDEASKMATIDMYQSLLGDQLQPEHLVETKIETVPSPADSRAENDETNSAGMTVHG